MTTLEKIYNLIEKSSNPLIFFDDDPDGLCSYLLIKKHFGKGNPIVIKSSPELDISYLKKISEYSPDLVIVLDKPIVSQDFIDKVDVPIIWIDHHPITDVKGVNYFNPLFNNKNDSRPVSYWCYQLTKENLWISAVGVASDYSLATVKEFNEKFPDLCEYTDDAGKIMFETKLGKLIKLFHFILKGNPYKILQYVAVMEKIESPYELLEGTSENAREIIKVYNKVNKEYEALLDDALKPQKSKLHIFLYVSGKSSFTSELSNEIIFRFKNKMILVGRKKNELVKLSLRYQKADLRKIVQKSLEGLEGTGGGHEHACGAHVKAEDFNEFVKRLESYIK